VGSFRNDTVGQNHGIKNLAGAFALADRRSILTAAKALDPEDHSVSENHVNVYPADVSGERDREGVRERIGAKVEEIKDALTDEDHRVVSEVRGFFSKNDDGESVEVPQPAGASGISTGPTEGPGVTDTTSTQSQSPPEPTAETYAGGVSPTGEAPVDTAPGTATSDNSPGSGDPGALGVDPTA
jgi:hypothetical protein